MALTLEAEQRMADVGLVKFYDDSSAAWLATVQATKDFVKSNFPAGALIRPDDVAKGLVPILEVHEGFKKYRDEKPLRGKFWIKFFCDLIVDRTWNKLT